MEGRNGATDSVNPTHVYSQNTAFSTVDKTAKPEVLVAAHGQRTAWGWKSGDAMKKFFILLLSE